MNGLCTLAEAAYRAVMLFNYFAVAYNILPLGKVVLFNLEKLAAAFASLPMLGAVPNPTGKVVTKSRNLYLVLCAAYGAAAELESLFGAGRFGDDLYILKVIFAGFPLCIKVYFKSAVFGKLTVEYIEVAGLIGFAAAVLFGVPTSEVIALASKRAVITIVDVAYLCNIAVILFVIIIAVVARAAYAAVCIIVKHIAASSDENIIGCFCGYGSVGNNDFGTVCKSDCNNKFVLAGAGYIVVLKGEVCGGRALIDVAIGKRHIILIPLIAVFECSIFGDSAGLNGNGLFKIVINRAAQGELYLRGLDFALLEQLVVSCKGDYGSVADRSIGYIAVFINKVPTEVLEAVYIARRRKIAVFLAIGYSDGCKLASAVAVKGYGIGVCFPLCNIGCICGYLFRNNRAPTGEGVAGAGGSSVECGSCFVLFYLHGNIRKGFAVYAIGIGYMIVTVKEELCACCGGIIVAVE